MSASNVITLDKIVCAKAPLKNTASGKPPEQLSVDDIKTYANQFLDDLSKNTADFKNSPNPVNNSNIKKIFAEILTTIEKNSDLKIKQDPENKELTPENQVFQALAHLDPNQREIIMENLKKPLENSPVLKQAAPENPVNEPKNELSAEIINTLAEKQKHQTSQTQNVLETVNPEKQNTYENSQIPLKDIAKQVSTENSQPQVPVSKEFKPIREPSAFEIDKNIPNPAHADKSNNNKGLEIPTVLNRTEIDKKTVIPVSDKKTDSSIKINANQFASPSPDAVLGRPTVINKAYTVAENINTQNPTVNQLNYAIKTNFVGTDRDMTVTLSPPELGKVIIKFSEMDKEITGRLEVESAQVKADIEKSMPEIVRTLQTAGVNIRKVEVSVNFKNDTAQNEQDLINDWQSQQQQKNDQPGQTGDMENKLIDDEETENPNIEHEMANEFSENDSLNIYM